RRPGISCFPPEVGGVAADGSIHNGSVRRRNGVLPDARFGVPARRGFHRGFCLDYLVISPSPFRETKAKLLMESALSIARVLKRRKRNSFVSPACISVKNFCKDALDKVIMTPLRLLWVAGRSNLASSTRRTICSSSFAVTRQC